MTLNLNTASFGANAASRTTETAQVAQGMETSSSQKNEAFRGLSITKAKASTEDIAAASINDAALTRDDPLGNLVKSAFNLPPPPPPWESL